MSFLDDWTAVESQVRRFCARSVRNPAIADEVLQQTRIRAWRGYDSFQGRAAFLTWVLTIARRETAREMGRHSRFVPLESIPEPEAPAEEPAAGASLAEGLEHAIEDAISRGELSGLEAAVVRSRLANPDSSWAVVAAALSTTANNCAVVHFRAMNKLRVFLFRFHQHRLGGRSEVTRAFEAALAAASARRLTASEAATFRRCCADDDGAEPRRGELEDLRTACVKVALQLELY